MTNLTRIAAAVVMTMVLTACSDPIVPTPGVSNCAEKGRIYSGDVGRGTWTRAASPHVLLDSVHVAGLLTIEPGALVCGMSGAVLDVDSLTAVGTADQPIVFSPAVEGEFWSGIRVRGEATLRHTRIVSTSAPVREASGIGASITLEDSHVLRSLSGIYAQTLVLRRVDVDSACYGTLTCVAVWARPYGSTTLEDVRIRDSGGRGVAAQYRCSIALSDVAIEGSAGTGLVLTQDVSGCGVSVQMPVSVSGGASYPLEVSGLHLAAHWLNAEGAELLRGNARDTIIISKPGDYAGALTIRKGMGVRITQCTGDIASFTRRLGRVTVEPGANLSIEGGCTWYMDLEMNGTAAEPATLIAPHSRIRSAQRPDTAAIRHAHVEGPVIIADSSAIVFEDVQLVDASLHLHASGARIDGLRAVGSAARWTSWPYESTDPPVIRLNARTDLRRAHVTDAVGTAVVVLGDASIRECTITGSGGHGIRVEAGQLSVRRCNIESNAGAGISSVSGFTVDALSNWWGDADGPLGPSGDGIEGSVQYTPWEIEPVQH